MPLRSSRSILVVTSVLGLAIVGAALYAAWWHLALNHGAESLHRRAEEALKADTFSHFLTESRYPDMFILRVDADTGGRLQPQEWDRLLSVGSVKKEQTEGQDRTTTYDYFAYGIRIYTVKVKRTSGRDSTELFTSNRAVRWYPSPSP